MPSIEDLKSRLEFRRGALKAAQEAYLALLNGQAQSYTIGSRSMTRLDLPELEKTIRSLEKEVDGLESQLNGGGRRKAVGILIRDY